MDNRFHQPETGSVIDVRTMDLADVRAIMLADFPELAETIARRQEWGADRHDEVWEGNYVMAPDPTIQHGLIQLRLAAQLQALGDPLGLLVSLTFNLGEGPKSFRVPDLGVHAEEPTTIFVPTALVAIEVLSPKDKSREKFGFYAARGVGEFWLVDGKTRTVELHVLTDGEYVERDSSPLFGIDSTTLAGFRWPATS